MLALTVEAGPVVLLLVEADGLLDRLAAEDHLVLVVLAVPRVVLVDDDDEGAVVVVADVHVELVAVGALGPPDLAVVAVHVRGPLALGAGA